MRRIFKLFLLLICCITFVSACGTKENNNTESNNTQGKNTEIASTQNTETETKTEKETETEDASDDVETVMYAQKNVNVRAVPSSDGEKLGMLSVNDKIIALGDAVNGWQKVRYNEKVAYVSAQYLGVEKVKVESSPETGLQANEITAEDFDYPTKDPNKKLIVIDAGHQGKSNTQKEPLGPGASTLKTKVAAGTCGVATKTNEYVLNLQVSLKLQKELEKRGYQVVMIRTTHNINISNAQRAIVANNLKADAFIRVHANGATNPATKGAETICQTANNPYNKEYYTVSKKLSECVLNAFCEKTGAVKRYVWETDTMTGINWCKVPTTIIEMGYMSNAEEDQLMSTADYQEKMVLGIANGIDKFFE